MADLVKSVAVRISTTGVEDAKLKIDQVRVKAEELKKLDPTITPQIDKAKALLEARLLRDGIKRELAGSLDIGGGAGASSAATAGAGIAGLVTPMSALITALVALAPVLLTVGFGLTGFGAAAVGAIQPVLKAAQATGGLQANMHKLNPEQQAVAQSLLDLGKQYHAFEKALQPQVLGAFGAGLRLAGSLMHDLQPVAKTTGTAIGHLLDQINAEFQSQTWQNFFGFMARTAAPDIALIGKNLTDLLQILPGLLQDLQPVAVTLLNTTDDALKLAGAIDTIARAEGRLGTSATHSSGFLGTLGKAAQQALGQLVPGIPALGQLRNGLDKAASSSAKTGPAAKAAGLSIKTMGGEAATSAAQVTNLYNALHKLLDPLTQNINDAVTFKTDQNQLASALRKSHDVLGLHTAAQRASSQAAATAAQDALTLSQSIYTQTGNAQKAIAPLESLAKELEKNGAKGDYARRILRELQAAIAALQSKTITVTTNVVSNAVTVNGKSIPGHPLVAPHAAGGPASGLIMTGERGRELLQVPPGSYVYNNQQTEAMMSGRSGGNTYNIHVSALVADRNTGRLVVEAIRQFEQGSGHGWRK